jgi:lipopolysaccharide export system permease protein
VDGYVLKELVLPFLWGVGAFSAIMLGIQALFELVRLASQGTPLSQVGLLFLYKLPGIVVLTFPMAMLLSTLLSFGRLSGESELVAMLASGISLARILVPIVLFSMLVVVLTYEFNERLVPWTSREAVALLEKIRPGTRNQAVILPSYESGELTQILSASKVDPDRNVMRWVTFIRYRSGQPELIVTADEATYDNAGNWRFRSGKSYLPQKQGIGSTFQEQVISLGQTPEQVRQRQQKKPEEMNFRELQQFIQQQQAEGLPTREWEVKLYHKLSLPFTSLVFALLGAPLGLRPHRGSSSLGLGLSIIVIFVFYMFTAYMHILGGNGLVPPLLAAWAPNGLGMAAAGALLARAPR